MYARLRAVLFPGDGCEAVAIVLAGRHAAGDRDVLLVHEVIPVPHSAYKVRTPDRVTWSTEFLSPLLEQANKRGLSIIKFHSHPSGFAEFSVTDDQSDRELFGSIHGWVDGVTLHASAILLPDGALVVRAVLADGTFQRFDRVTVIGDQIQTTEFMAEPAGELPAYAARHALALGEVTTQLLRKLRVGVVGSSGTGSFVIEELLRLGVGEIVVVDPDVIEDVNINRILNSTMADARAALLKVKIVERTAAILGTGVCIKPIALDLAQRESVVALAGCDAVIGCMDSHDGRRLLNRIATFYVIPYIDVGVRIDAKAGRIDHISGAVHYIQPGQSSLLSRGVIDNDIANAEALKRVHPDLYRERLNQGYIRGAADVSRPAVISINGTFASMAVTELLARLHHFREDDASLAEQRLCVTDGYYSTKGEGDPCEWLQDHVGRGDVEPLLDMPGLGCSR